MTLPPERLGDKGQRYEVHCVGYPERADNIIGWTGTREGAIELGLSTLKAPSASIVYTLDRETDAILDRNMRG
ncbi:hypothetical protein TRICHSKD4_2279 [Roseibium sp. TrichSKD4]|uniref:hypothetical protein n=1 Tax=Roseibium sp. TrichSKD4 TaxID=744980 RepID=UPI0001E56940|nr:hypothetical protein [Roseibium sp. TrichSKD4]EFO32480.1 hypothetical protein TRICHSKD4_2279 [Roseibium sp. TrichSKD4]